MDIDESCLDIIGTLSSQVPGETEENNEIPLRIANFLAKIRTDHLPNVSSGRYRCTSLLGYTAMKLSHERRTCLGQYSDPRDCKEDEHNNVMSHFTFRNLHLMVTE
jgi:hypothetical protein